MVLSEIPYDKLHEKLLGTALDSIGRSSFYFVEYQSCLLELYLSISRYV